MVFLGLVGKGSKKIRFSQQDLTSWAGDAEKQSFSSVSLALCKDIINASFRGKQVLGIDLQGRGLQSCATRRDTATVTRTSCPFGVTTGLKSPFSCLCHPSPSPASPWPFCISTGGMFPAHVALIQPTQIPARIFRCFANRDECRGSAPWGDNLRWAKSRCTNAPHLCSLGSQGL